LEKVELIEIAKVHDSRGNLSFIQNSDEFPFVIKRVFWIYDVPGGSFRGGHAYKTQKEIIIAISGSFDVVVVDPSGRERKYFLNRSYLGLYIPSNYWRKMENFSTNAVSLHICSGDFNEEDYTRDLNSFLNRK
jgi:dTDP-4-dehydrorhamnose 3,5-epimerase-like enzyme